jgi:hypothetical protein
MGKNSLVPSMNRYFFFSAPVQTNTGAHPASDPIGKGRGGGIFSPGAKQLGMKLAT